MMDIVQSKANDKTRWAKLLDSLLLYGPFIAALTCFGCCLLMEIFRVELSQSVRDEFYSTFGSISFYSNILLSVVYGRKYKLSWLRCLLFSLASFYLVFSLATQAWTWLDVQMFGVGAYISGRSLTFLPLLCLLLARFCKVDTLNLCDYLTPYFMLHHGIVTVACWIAGCCAGRQWPWGIHNPISGLIVFPTQPCIIILSVGIALWGLLYSKKHDYQANGKVFANSLCFYGIGRYIIELFTDDTGVWWVRSWFAICSLAMIVEGFFVRAIANKHYKNLS